MGYGPYNKTIDIGPASGLDIRHSSLVPESPEALKGWLDDTGAIPEAEVYRFLDEEMFDSVLRDAAERIYLDVRGDYYSASEATEMYLRRQSEGRLGSYAVRISGEERHVVVTTVDSAA